MIHLLSAIDSIEAVITALGVLLSGLLGLFFNFLTKDRKQAAEDRKAERDERTAREAAHNEALGKLSFAIDKNTVVTDKSLRVQEETITYLKHRNGSFEKLIKDAPALHELLKRVDK